MSNRPIGIFDSGIGGLTVLKKIRQYLPHEPLIYLGDTARVPYGIKSSQVVQEFSSQDTRFLLQFQPKLIVIACHTASALASDFLRTQFPETFFVDVVTPSVEKAWRVSGTKRIGIVGTPATIRSGRYQELLKKKGPVHIFARACPLFVPLIEEGWQEHSVSLEVAKIYLRDIKQRRVDTLILGCTHYPLLKKVIGKIMGEGVKLVDASEEVARDVRDSLQKRRLQAGPRKQTVRLFFSDCSAHLRGMIPNFLKGTRVRIEEARLECTNS